MSFDLKFKNPNLEQNYTNSIKGTRLLYLKFYVVSVFICSNLLWFANPHQLPVFQGTLLGFYLLNNCLMLGAIIILFRKNSSFNNPQLGILLFQIYVCCGYIESSRNFRTVFTSSSYVMITLMMENIILIPLISCCSWKIISFSSAALNAYLHLRFLENEHNQLMNWYPTMVFFGNFLVNSLGGYINEKYNREKFWERRNLEESQKQYENIIKEVLPSGIIISRRNDIVFFNKGARNLLSFKDKKELKIILNDILIEEIMESQQINYEEKEIVIFNFKSEEKTNSQKFLADLLDENPEESCANRFKRFRGKRRKFNSEGSFCYYEIQVGSIKWEGKKAQIIIISDDIVTQQLNLLQEEAQYKDQLLATVSHDLRTPLMGIIGMLDLMLETVLERPIRKRYY